MTKSIVKMRISENRLRWLNIFLEIDVHEIKKITINGVTHHLFLEEGNVL